VPERPPLIGVTGGIAAGKSEVLAAFARRGCAVLSADAIVHRLYDRAPVRDAVVARFGDDVLRADGEIDRVALARRVLADPTELTWLEDLLHPRVRVAMEEWVSDVAAADPLPPLIVYESPLLFEVGLETAFDRTLAVVAPAEIRHARLQRRGGLEGLAAREARQCTDEERTVRADDVIHNTGDLGELVAQVDAYIDRHAGGR